MTCSAVEICTVPGRRLRHSRGDRRSMPPIGIDRYNMASDDDCVGYVARGCDEGGDPIADDSRRRTREVE